MKIEFEKKMHMVSDLLSYCHLRGADEFSVDITDKGGTAVFIIKASPANIDDDEMEVLKKKLNAPRHREIEQDFWGVIGESENFSELTLVGMMSDEASVDYDGKVLKITISRHD